MYKRFLAWGKSLLIYALAILFLSLALDYYRRPDIPKSILTTPLNTVNQKNITLAQLSHNQITVLYFWGSWCGVCRHTSPVIEALRQDGVSVLGVALSSGDAREVAT